MPLRNVQIVPGFNKADTPSGAEGQWIDGDFVRFRYGQPEKIGGFQAIGTNTISGPTRAQHTWTDLEGKRYAALGTSKALYIYYEDKFYDITPLATAITGATFSSTQNSNVVTVTKASHGLDVGEYITFTSVSLPGGGATGFTVANFQDFTFEILTVPTTSTFTVQMKSNETGTGMSTAGGATINPYEEIGPTIQTYGYGWGTSTWSRLTWGSGSTTSSVILDPGTWSLDNFGQQLIATVKDGKTFVWNPGVSNPLENRAVVMSGAPTATRLTITSDRDRHVVHFGTETTIGDATTQDPMFIRFSDQENFSAYQMQFVGPPFTFSIRQVGSNCGCIGQHGVVYADGRVYWMGSGGGFFVFDGTVKLLPSLVEDFVFTTTGSNVGVNYSSNEIIYASHNSLFNEIVWFYPAGTPSGNPAVQNNRAVVYNYVENSWSTMSLARSSYADASTYAVPYTTTAIPAYIQSGDFDLPTEGDGEYILRLSRFLPDFKNLQGNAIVTIFLKNFPIDGGTSSQLGPFTINSTTQKIDTRARGRLANIKIQNTAVDETWRFGTFRADVNPDGRR